MSEQIYRIIKETEANLYNWFLNDTETEVLHDFPCLRTINGSGVKSYIEYLIRFSPDEKLERAKLLSRRLSKAEEGMMTDADRGIVEEFISFYLATRSELISSSRASSPEIMSKYTVSVKRIRSCLQSELKRICGEIVSPNAGNEWVHSRIFGRWTVTTTVLIRKRGPQLRYSHMLILDEKMPLPILIDKMRWMGGGETEWDQLQEGDEARACQQLTDLCTHFMESIPLLLVQK